ncbi:hypothetical protein [Spongiivirga citrea]|uniref:Uncharacterized protein n=1 Tax=Spongiivirga citrea TaxID=1481457 RepID=A0A6M0CPR4_9FLAO|nr:hypothetical protein [Spongiivirga citrea]NER18024.1 hypothetical protein [Spongiivirga citrea]
MKNQLSRRLFFQQLVLAGAGAYMLPLLQACDANSKFKIPEGSGVQPFKTWEEMLYALSYSPDNFQAKRDRLVQEKDPQAMFNFVRDELILLPSDDQYFRAIKNGFQYGTSGALRTGMATPREKANILRDMLVTAGFEARLVYEHIELSEDEVKNILFRETQTLFEPPVPKRQYKKWKKALQFPDGNGMVNETPDVVEQAKQLATSLLEKVSPKQRKEDSTIRFHFGNRNVPAVALKQNGQELYLHLFDPSVAYGMMHPTNVYGKVYDLPEIDEPDMDVTISLKATNSFNMREEDTLLTATYKASELAGNQLKVNFLNNLTFEEMATQTIGSINTFTPSIALQDMSKDAAYLEERSFLGEPITLSGEKVFEQATMFAELNSQDNKPGLVDNVTKMTATVKPKVFPQVELELRPVNAEGNVVEGLTASNFKIEDNGQVVRGILRRNLIAPKVLIVYDTSGSMPSAYRGAGMDEFVKKTKESILQDYPHAKVDTWKVGSNVYTSALRASQTDNDLVLYATDAHNGDTYDPKFKSFYDAGPPIIYLNVYESDTFYKYLRKNLDFTEIPASDTEATIAKVNTFLGEMELTPYVFQYNAFEEEGQHQVTISLNKTIHQANTIYTFPETIDAAVGKRLVGLSLYIKVSGQYEQRKLIAGYDRIVHSRRPTVAMANAVHEAMMGSMTMAFEHAGATDSIRFSEYLQSLLSTRSWMEPYLKNDTKAALEAIKKGGFDYPSVFLSMMQSIQQSVNTNSATYVKGLRIGVLTITPALFTKNSRISFDYLRTSQYRTLTKSGTGWFLANAQKTAQLALLEASVFPENTHNQLQNLELAFSENLPKGIYNADFLGENYRYFYEYIFRGGKLNFFDASAEKLAFWSIDHYYGELYGMLPDLTGGGGQSVAQQLKRIDDVVKEYQRLLGAMNLGIMAAGGGLALGIVSAYSLTLVRLYAFASEAIVIMDASGMDDKIRKAIAELACNVYKEILYTGLGPIGTGMAGVENLIAMMGGSYSFVSCP